MKYLVHAKEGYVVVATIKEGKVVCNEQEKLPFEVGKKDSTIPNAMLILGKLLNRIAKEGYTNVEVAVTGSVADKVNSNILVKEFRAGNILSPKRKLIKEEMDIYAFLISAIKRTYGDALILSEGYISHSLKAGQTQDQTEWANIYMSAKAMVDGITMPAPTVAGNPAIEGEPDDDDLAI